MKKIIIATLPAFIIAAALQAHALSLGVYAGGAAGRMFLSDATRGKQVHENYSPGCGILLQTPLGRVKDAGYRLGFGFDRVFIPRTTRLATDFDDVYRMNLNNLLTYSFYNRDRVSLWVGPHLAFSIVSGRAHSTGSKRLRDLAFLPALDPDVVALILLRDALNRHNSFTDYTLGLAPVIGIDYRANRYITVSADAGFRGGVHLGARNPGSRYRYEGFCELAMLVMIPEDSAPEK